MIIKVNCTTCKNHHFDHYECSNCNTRFGGVPPSMEVSDGLDDQGFPKSKRVLYKYCPICGEKFL